MQHIRSSSLELGVQGLAVTSIGTDQHLPASVVWHRVVHRPVMRNAMNSSLMLYCTYAALCRGLLSRLVRSCECAFVRRLKRTTNSIELR